MRLKKRNAKFGSIGILMRYGEYIAKYPDGRRNDSAHGDSQGYCIISKSDPKNICWITLREFAMYQRMHEIATKNEGAACRQYQKGRLQDIAKQRRQENATVCKKKESEVK